MDDLYALKICTCSGASGRSTSHRCSSTWTCDKSRTPTSSTRLVRRTPRCAGRPIPTDMDLFLRFLSIHSPVTSKIVPVVLLVSPYCASSCVLALLCDLLSSPVILFGPVSCTVSHSTLITTPNYLSLFHSHSFSRSPSSQNKQGH